MLAFSACMPNHLEGIQNSRAFPWCFNDPLGSMVCTNPTVMNADRHNEHKGLMHREITRKFAPWYSERPHDFLGFHVAVLHRKCVLYFQWSRISGQKLWWILNEWDVKSFITFSLHRCKETGCLLEKSLFARHRLKK